MLFLASYSQLLVTGILYTWRCKHHQQIYRNLALMTGISILFLVCLVMLFLGHRDILYTTVVLAFGRLPASFVSGSSGLTSVILSQRQQDRQSSPSFRGGLFQVGSSYAVRKVLTAPESCADDAANRVRLRMCGRCDCEMRVTNLWNSPPEFVSTIAMLSRKTECLEQDVCAKRVQRSLTNPNVHSHTG